MPSNLTTKVYSYIWKQDSMRQATITFEATAPDKWRFSGCNFVGVHSGYDLDDWEFLGMLADEIKRLCREEGVTL